MFNPRYTITNSIVSKLSQIAEIKSVVERSRLLPAKEVFLKRAAIIKIAHTSTSIEGNTLAEFEVAKVAQGVKITAEASQITEVKNYLRALQLIDEIATKKQIFTTEDILRIHKLTMDNLITQEKIGAWRKHPVYVVNVLASGKEKLIYTPPPANTVGQFMTNLMDWVKENQHIHPVIRAGLFHYQFETIHPFPDGNGRTGRLATLLHLYQSDWNFRKILVLEDFYNQDRKKYYLALQTGNSYESHHGADLTNWLEYFIEGFLYEANKVKDAIANIHVQPQASHAQNTLSTEELKIVDFVLTIGKITSSDVMDILKIPKRTAQDKLKKLENIKVLEKHGKGPATSYVIPNE